MLQYSKIVILSKYYKSYHVCKANRIYSQYIIHFSQLLSLYFSKILKIIFFFLRSTCFIRIFPAGNLFLLLMTFWTEQQRQRCLISDLTCCNEFLQKFYEFYEISKEILEILGFVFLRANRNCKVNEKKFSRSV